MKISPPSTSKPFPAWTSGKVVMQWPTFILLLAGVLVNSLWYTALMIPYATNRHGRIAVFYTLVYGAFAFVLGYLGAKSVGFVGAALALFCVEAAMAVIVIRTSLRLTQMRMSQWIHTTLSMPFKIISKPLFIRTDLW